MDLIKQVDIIRTDHPGCGIENTKEDSNVADIFKPVQYPELNTLF